MTSYLCLHQNEVCYNNNLQSMYFWKEKKQSMWNKNLKFSFTLIPKNKYAPIGA